MMHVHVWLGLWFWTMPGTSGDAVDQVLLDRARNADEKSDAALRDGCLRVWAARRPREGARVDSNLEAPAARLLETVGQLRVFGFRQGDRLRVGLIDPGRVVDEWRVSSIGLDGVSIPMVQVPGAPEGRRDFRLSKPEHRMVVELVTQQCGSALTIFIWEMPGQTAALPLPPVAPAPVPPPVDPPSAPPRNDEIPWWWIALGAVAVFFTGAAVWQETRF